MIGQYIDQLDELAEKLDAPVIKGETPVKERQRLFEAFRSGEVGLLVVSKVANFSIDLPSAEVAIQVSGSFGSRQEEAQRLGRLLRPKEDGKTAHFYTIVSRDTVDADFAQNRQRFLAEQGYAYRIVDAEDLDRLSPAEHRDTHGESRRATGYRVPSLADCPPPAEGDRARERTMEHITTTLVSWASILEDNTREQAVTASTMPFIHPHLALMPDAHLGLGATVGSVIPTLGAIMPGRGRRRHRLRHDRRPHARTPSTSCPADRRRAARGDRAGRAAVGGRRQPGGQPRPHRGAARDAARARPSEAGFDPASYARGGSCSWAPSARATTSSR